MWFKEYSLIKEHSLYYNIWAKEYSLIKEHSSNYNRVPYMV